MAAENDPEIIPQTSPRPGARYLSLGLPWAPLPWLPIITVINIIIAVVIITITIAIIAAIISVAPKMESGVETTGYSSERK